MLTRTARGANRRSARGVQLEGYDITQHAGVALSAGVLPWVGAGGVVLSVERAAGTCGALLRSER